MESDRAVIDRFNKEFPNIKTNIEETYFEDWNSDERFDVIKAGHKRYYTLASLKKEITEAKLRKILEEGLFLKPITTAQILGLNLEKKIVDGYLKVGKDYPELCLGLMIEAIN